MFFSLFFTEMKANKRSLQELPSDVDGSVDDGGTDVDILQPTPPPSKKVKTNTVPLIDDCMPSTSSTALDTPIAMLGMIFNSTIFSYGTAEKAVCQLPYIIENSVLTEIHVYLNKNINSNREWDTYFLDDCITDTMFTKMIEINNNNNNLRELCRTTCECPHIYKKCINNNFLFKLFNKYCYLNYLYINNDDIVDNISNNIFTFIDCSAIETVPNFRKLIKKIIFFSLQDVKTSQAFFANASIFFNCELDENVYIYCKR